MNTTLNQIDLVRISAQYLSKAFTKYYAARKAFEDFQTRSGGLNLAQLQMRYTEESRLFNKAIASMHEARRCHDEYMALESHLNQMGGMKKCT